jgi:preprotein translocase subunit YajC
VFQAEPAAGPAGSGFTTILFLLLLFGVVYFLMIRPQQKRRREAVQMQSSLTTGDRIVTIGGLHATVVAIDDDVATLEIAPGVTVQFARPAIARVLPREDAVADDEAEAVAGEVPADEVPVDDTITDTRKKD